MINEILARFIFLANVLIPKRNIIYLFSTMAYKDNIQAVLEEIINSNINNNYTIVCDGPGFDLYKGKNIIHVKHLTLYSLYMFLRSKFIIYDIGIYGQIKGGKNQVLINTWHGTSLKKIE